MTKRSSTFTSRTGRRRGTSGSGSVCESRLMHQTGHSRTQSMQEVQAGSISRIRPCAPRRRSALIGRAAGHGRR